MRISTTMTDWLDVLEKARSYYRELNAGCHSWYYDLAARDFTINLMIHISEGMEPSKLDFAIRTKARCEASTLLNTLVWDKIQRENKDPNLEALKLYHAEKEKV